MPIVILPMLLIIVFFIIAIATIISFDTNEKVSTRERSWKAAWISLLVFCAGVVWNIAYANQPWRYVNEQTLPVTIIDNKAIVIYYDQPYNINSYLHRQFKDGDKISVKQRDDGFYLGLLPIDDRIIFEAVE